MSKTTAAEFASMTRYPFACECGEPDCRRRLTLTRQEFETRAVQGPVLATVCRITHGMSRKGALA